METNREKQGIEAVSISHAVNVTEARIRENGGLTRGQMCFKSIDSFFI